MHNPLVERLQRITTFPQLVKYLRDDLEWPIEQDKFEDVVFDWDAEELGLDFKTAAKISEIKQLRPLVTGQPWGIFFVKFEPKRLPIVALRRILSQLVLRKRASARKADQQTWQARDLLFISSHGEGSERQITFAHFNEPSNERDLPTLRVLGWDGDDTALHLDHAARTLKEKLTWPTDLKATAAWRERWSSAFVLHPREVIQTAKELAVRLAELAKGIRDRAGVVLEMESERGTLRQLHKAFQEALIHDLTQSDFADMYAQTITYGLFSAAVAGEGAGVKGGLVAEDVGEQVPVTNPFLRELLGHFLKAGGRKGKLDFDELGVQDVVDLLNSPDTQLDAVLRDFGNRTRDEDPVIHFYESFLQEYDHAKKVARGVFYTPQPLVSYIVRSLDELLRSAFGLADGLADTTTWAEVAARRKDVRIPKGVAPAQAFVQVLDPATGTGTFLIEVIDIIHRTLVAKWKAMGHKETKIDSLWNEYVPRHLLPRLHGYELLMAPYAIAHLKVGLKLYETHYRFANVERARIYLTNALEPASDSDEQIGFQEWIPALAHEASAVNAIKRERRFTVLLGNPPYSGHSANKGAWVSQLLRDYYVVDGAPLGEKNTKWLQDDYVKFVRVAQYNLAMSGLGVVGLITNHGYLDNPTFRGMRKSLLDSFSEWRVLDLHGNSKRKERATDGSPDENVFDIQQGVAISIGVIGASGRQLRHADMYGLRAWKYSGLVSATSGVPVWQPIVPSAPLYLLTPQDNKLRSEYEACWPLNTAMPTHSLGVVTARDALCVHWSRADTWRVVREFASMAPEKARLEYALGPDARDWRVKLAQEDLRRSGPTKDHVRQIYYRPFDWRWTYYTGRSRGFHCMPRREVMQHMLPPNSIGLSTTRSVEVGDFSHVLVTNALAGHHCVSLKEVNYLFPLWLAPHDQVLLGAPHPNFSRAFLAAFKTEVKPLDVFNYIYAILHSPTYRRRYGQFLKSDFPRIPLPGNRGTLDGIASMGRELVALHLMESPELDKPRKSYAGPKGPKVGRIGWSNGTVWLDVANTSNGPTGAVSAGFRHVPQAVWECRIGGYQVCDRWLKDRAGFALSDDEIAQYQRIVVALAETMRIMEEIDEVIEKYGGWPGAFSIQAQHEASPKLPLRLVAETRKHPYEDGEGG